MLFRSSESYFWPVVLAVVLHVLIFAMLFVSWAFAPELPPSKPIVQATLYCPGYLAIGDDSGGRAVVMALDDHRQALFLVDHGAMTPDCFEPLAPSLEAWLEAGPCLPE